MQSPSPDAGELMQRRKSFVILFGIVWFLLAGAVLVYKLIINDPAD